MDVEKGVETKRGKERERCRERGKQSSPMGRSNERREMSSEVGEGGKGREKVREEKLLCDARAFESAVLL